MNKSESPLLTSARREALVVALVWLVTLTFTVGWCYRFGYGRPVDELTFILGFPDWIFWGVAVPWVCCFLFSVWFAGWFMQDAPMGDDDQATGADEEPPRG